MTEQQPLDPDAMMDAVRGLPDQLETAWARVATLSLPDACRDVDGVVVAGMGGSAIGGDLAASLLADTLPVPMSVVRDYNLPRWVGERTLVVGSSFSGNTEETLSAYRSAGKRGARRVAVTSGGQLADLARTAGDPIVAVPPGGQPRAALGNSLASILGVLHAARLIDDPAARVAAAVRSMRDLVRAADDGAADDGEAHAVARVSESLTDRMPVIYAPEDMAPVACRWKAQLNENAKVTAAWDTLPELNHNAVVGYGGPSWLGERVHVVLLDAPGTPPRTTRRAQVTTELLEDHGIPFTSIAAPDGPRFAGAMWLVQLGDLVSVRLAYNYGVDPTPVAAITKLKAALG